MNKAIFITFFSIFILVEPSFSFGRSTVKRNKANVETDFKISKDACLAKGSIDYSERFGPIRDQDGHGFCWAFVGADLVSEQLCLENKKFCKVRLSVLDAARENWVLGEDSEGGLPEHVFFAMNNGGVCLESDAPFYESKNILCNLFLGKNRCFVNKIKKHASRFFKYYDWYSHPNDLSCERDPKVLKEIDILQNKINKLNKAVYFSKKDLIESLENSVSNPTYILKEFFIRKECKDNRIKFSRGNAEPIMHELINDVDHNGDRFLSNTQKIKTITEIMARNNRSLGLAICSNYLLGSSKREHKKYKFSDNKNLNCGKHVVTLIGNRWNNKKKKCEVKVRNSWGKNSLVNGWVDAETILNTSFALNYFDINQSSK